MRELYPVICGELHFNDVLNPAEIQVGFIRREWD